MNWYFELELPRRIKLSTTHPILIVCFYLFTSSLHAQGYIYSATDVLPENVCDVPENMDTFNSFLDQKFGEGISGADINTLVSEFGFSLPHEREIIYAFNSLEDIVKLVATSISCTAPDDVEYKIVISAVVSLQGEPIDGEGLIMYDKEIALSGMRDYSFLSFFGTREEHTENLSAIFVGKLNASEVKSYMARIGCSYLENINSVDDATTDRAFCPINMETNFHPRLALWDFSKRITFTYDSENLVNSVRVR